MSRRISLVRGTPAARAAWRKALFQLIDGGIDHDQVGGGEVLHAVLAQPEGDGQIRQAGDAGQQFIGGRLVGHQHLCPAPGQEAANARAAAEPSQAHDHHAFGCEIRHPQSFRNRDLDGLERFFADVELGEVDALGHREVKV